MVEFRPTHSRFGGHREEEEVALNVINFPICRHIKGRHWYGGRGFLTKQEVIDTMSERTGGG